MKEFISRVEEYLQTVSLEDISDRRFVAILDIYKLMQKEEKEEIEEERDVVIEELLSFMDSLEDLQIE